MTLKSYAHGSSALRSENHRSVRGYDLHRREESPGDEMLLMGGPGDALTIADRTLAEVLEVCQRSPVQIRT